MLTKQLTFDLSIPSLLLLDKTNISGAVAFYCYMVVSLHYENNFVPYMIIDENGLTKQNPKIIFNKI